MAISPDGGTLIVAESYANRLTAYEIGADGAATGGCGRRRPAITQTGSASMPRALSGTPTWVTSAACGCEGGEVLATVNLDRGAFACALSGGQDLHLFVVGQNFGGPQSVQPSRRVVAFSAPAPGAGKP